MKLFQIGFISVTLVDFIDILLVTWIFYKVYQYFKETRAGQMLIGLVILLIASFLFNSFGLSAMSWLVNQFQTVWVVAFVILYFLGDTYVLPAVFSATDSGNMNLLMWLAIDAVMLLSTFYGTRWALFKFGLIDNWLSK